MIFILISGSDFTRGNDRIWCRRDHHRNHSYGIPGTEGRFQENLINSFPDGNQHLITNDRHLPKPYAFFGQHGSCYFGDQISDQLGGHRGAVPAKAIYDVNMASVQLRAYNGANSTTTCQSTFRSCARPIPFFSSVEGTDGPIVDTDGETHPNDVRPLMAFDQFGRYVKIDFVKTVYGRGEDQPGSTRVVARLNKRGPNGYFLTEERPRNSQWNAPFDSLDLIRNCNLILRENFNKIPAFKEEEKKFFVKLSEKKSDGSLHTNAYDLDLVIDEEGNVISGHNLFKDSYSKYAYWSDQSDLIPEDKLPAGYFDSIGVSDIGTNHSVSLDSISCVDGRSTGLVSVTFSDLTAPAHTICGPVFDHLFVRKSDLIDQMEEFIDNRQFLSRDALRQILRLAKKTQKTKWIHFPECFNFDGSWKTVCGPIRGFLESGGRLDQKEEVQRVLDGATNDQIECLLSSAARLGLRTKTDFAHPTGNSYPFTNELCLSFVLVPIRSLEFGQFKSVNVLEKDRLYKFYQTKSPIQYRDQSTPFCGVSGVLDISIRDRLAKGKIFTSHYGDLHVNGKFFPFPPPFSTFPLNPKVKVEQLC